MHPLVFIGLAIAAFGVVCDIADDVSVSASRCEPSQPRMCILTVEQFEELVQKIQENE